MTSKLIKTGVLALSLLALGSAVTTMSSLVVDQPAFAQSAGGGGHGGGGGGGGGGAGGGAGGSDGFASPHYATGVVPGGPNTRPPRVPPLIVSRTERPPIPISCHTFSPTSPTYDSRCRIY